jgi:hypothetical protein
MHKTINQIRFEIVMNQEHQLGKMECISFCMEKLQIYAFDYTRRVKMGIYVVLHQHSRGVIYKFLHLKRCESRVTMAM